MNTINELSIIPILYSIWDGDDLFRVNNFIESANLTVMEKFEVVFICNSNKQHFQAEIKAIVRKCKPNFKYSFFSAEDVGPFYYFSFVRFLKGKPFPCVILLDSDAVVNHEHWANILIAPILEGRTKVCASMASWESYTSTRELTHRILITKMFKDISLESESILKATGSTPIEINEYKKKIIKKIFFNKIKFAKLQNLIINYIAKKTFNKNSKRLRNFPKFPNPSLRMCGMAIDSGYLLAKISEYSGSSTKLDALLFESGCNSVSNSRTNKSTPLVYTSKGFLPITDYNSSESFRTETNFTPIVTDDHFEAFKTCNSEIKQALHKLTWSFTELSSI